MRLTRKHFEEFARLFGRAIAGNHTEAVLDDLTDLLKDSNPAFDEERFQAAVLDEIERLEDQAVFAGGVR